MPSRLSRHNESGHVHLTTFCCYRRLQFFRHASVRDTFVEIMAVIRSRLGIRWIGYVVMPEHVHLLVLPQATDSSHPVPISTVLNELKGLSGKMCKEALRVIWRKRKTLGTLPRDEWALGDGVRQFWKPRGHDFNVTSERKVIEKLKYIHVNPVRRGLVDAPEDWAWSSYRFYELGDSSKISMDWDGAFPMG